MIINPDDPTPRVVQVYEYFLDRLSDLHNDIRDEAALHAAAVWFFDPPEDEIEVFGDMVMVRVESWYMQEDAEDN